jgi:hypothetical protein
MVWFFSFGGGAKTSGVRLEIFRGRNEISCASTFSAGKLNDGETR